MSIPFGSEGKVGSYLPFYSLLYFLAAWHFQIGAIIASLHRVDISEPEKKFVAFPISSNS